MNTKINIAIDGHSSCGKSTIAKAISKRYKMRYIDTGACIETFVCIVLQNNLISKIKLMKHYWKLICQIFLWNLNITRTRKHLKHI